MPYFSGKSFVVTGASSGIGRAICLDLNQREANIIAIARSREKLDSLKSEAKFPDGIFTYSIDLSENIDGLFKQIVDISSVHGKLSGMVLAAGIRHTIPLKAITAKRTRELFDINVISNLQLAKGFCDSRCNIGESSSIVFISSIAAGGEAGILEYSASKAAINSIIISLAKEMIPKKIRVNGVSLGFVLTDMLRNDKYLYTDGFADEIEESYPLGIGVPEDVAPAVRFLLSDDAKWITGSNFVIDGGASLL